MSTIHLLLDTKAKREYSVCLLFMVGWLGECIMNMIFLVRVIPIQRLESLYELIPVARYGVIGRLVIAMFNLTSYDFNSVAWAILTALSLPFVALLAMSLYVLTTKYPSRALLVTRKFFRWVALWAFMSLLVLSWYVVFRLEFSSYQIAMGHVLVLSKVLLGATTIGFLVVLLGWVRLMVLYLDALQYDAVEIEQ